jgi:hypothetical protein
MTVATPTQDTVLAAVKTAMDAIAPSIGTVYNGFHTYEDDREQVDDLISSGNLDVWFVDLASADEFEGPASGEVYERYNIEIRYWSIRTADAAWSKKARIQAELVRDELSDKASIFAISGQQQLKTPTTVSIASLGP